MLLAFNDASEENIRNLETEIRALPESGELLKRTSFSANIVDSEFWEKIKINPTIPVLSFVDPFGYKGLSMQLISRLIENNGSECIFFFNYNRINMALSSNPYFDEHLAAIFGVEKTQELKERLASLPPAYREQVVVNELLTVLKANKATYILPFKFYCTEMKRTSHYIIFVTKHIAGYEIMKNIMYANSAKDVDGVATFEFKDKYNFGSQYEQLTLFSRPLDGLCEILVKEYAKKRVNIGEICNRIVYDTTNLFIAQNVKEALRRLEARGIVRIEGRKVEIVKGVKTMPDTAFAIFT